MNNTLKAAALVLGVLLTACGGGGGGGSDGGPGPISIVPATATVPVGGQKAFTLSPSASTTWSVDGNEGGNGTVGTISPIGLYTAPFVLPSLSTAILPSPSTAVPPSPLTVTVSASAAENTASVTVVSRFVVGGAVSVGPPCSGPPCPVHLPNAVVAADLNHDNRSDLVTANSRSGTISVLLAGPSGTFSDPRMDTVGDPSTGNPQALVAGGFNDDSNVDLAVADADPNDLAVRTLLGNGDVTGTFQTEIPSPLSTNSDPLSMAFGHFSNDTILDLVVANFNTSTVEVLMGNGTGSFSQPTMTIMSIETNPLGVAAADFNRDGFDDFTVANSGDGTVAVFLNNTNGGFPAAQTYLVPGSPSAVAAVDLNEDGCPDLAVTSAIDSTVTVLLNQKAGACASVFTLASPYPTGPRPIALASGDWNKDGASDLVVANHDGKTVTVFLGYGDGTLVNSETYPVGNEPQSVAVGDFNGDSWPDLAVANSGGDTVSILINQGQ